MYHNFGLSMGWGGLLVMALFWVGVIVLAAWLVKSLVTGTSSGDSSAQSILDERYANGELTRAEYMKMKKDIKS